MNIIQNFKLLKKQYNHNHSMDGSSLTINELLPYGVSWIYKGLEKNILFEKNGIALLLKDKLNIAIVVSPFCFYNNSAYIYDQKGDVKWDVGGIIGCQYKNVIFLDVYYIFEVLHFFINVNGQDYRFSFDVDTGDVGILIASL